MGPPTLRADNLLTGPTIIHALFTRVAYLCQAELEGVPRELSKFNSHARISGPPAISIPSMPLFE